MYDEALNTIDDVFRSYAIHKVREEISRTDFSKLNLNPNTHRNSIFTVKLTKGEDDTITAWVTVSITGEEFQEMMTINLGTANAIIADIVTNNDLGRHTPIEAERLHQ